MRLIEGQWQEFRQMVIPKDAPAIQLREMRRAFYAGAWAYYALVMNKLDSDREPTEADVKLLAALHQEMEDFAESMAQGKA